jgi:hypothetical protein
MEEIRGRGRPNRSLLATISGRLREYFAFLRRAPGVQEQLRRAEKLLSEAHHSVEVQEDLVREMRDAGRDTSAAETTLKTFKEAERAQQKIVDKLKKK